MSSNWLPWHWLLLKYLVRSQVASPITAAPISSRRPPQSLTGFSSRPPPIHHRPSGLDRVVSLQRLKEAVDPPASASALHLSSLGHELSVRPCLATKPPGAALAYKPPLPSSVHQSRRLPLQVNFMTFAESPSGPSHLDSSRVAHTFNSSGPPRSQANSVLFPL